MGLWAFKLHSLFRRHPILGSVACSGDDLHRQRFEIRPVTFRHVGSQYTSGIAVFLRILITHEFLVTTFVLSIPLFRVSAPAWPVLALTWNFTFHLLVSHLYPSTFCKALPQDAHGFFLSYQPDSYTPHHSQFLHLSSWLLWHHLQRQHHRLFLLFLLLFLLHHYLPFFHTTLASP